MCACTWRLYETNFQSFALIQVLMIFALELEIPSQFQ